MNDELTDDGPSTTGLWATGVVLGLVAGGCFIRLLTYATADNPVQTDMFVWLLLGALAGGYSACCAVLVGIRSAEGRLAQRPDQAAR